MRIIGIVLYLWASSVAHAGLNVFACEPEWAELAHRMGGKHVDVFSATNAHQDVHFIQARPGLIARLRKADLLICSGGGLEAGWLPVLLRRANNPKVQPGSPGNLVLSEGVTLIDKPARVDRAAGDVHPEGNPHFHLDPRNLPRAAQLITERLVALDPDNGADYESARDQFTDNWRRLVTAWEIDAAGLQGKAIVTHHTDWRYLMTWLGLVEIGTLEPKPGVPPSSHHLADLLHLLKSRPANCVVRSNHQGARASRWLADRAEIPAVQLPYTVGADARSNSLEDLFSEIIQRLKDECR